MRYSQLNGLCVNIILFPLLDRYLYEDRVYVLSLIYLSALHSTLEPAACTSVLNQSWLSGFLKQARKDWTYFRVLGWVLGNQLWGQRDRESPHSNVRQSPWCDCIHHGPFQATV